MNRELVAALIVAYFTGASLAQEPPPPAQPDQPERVRARAVGRSGMGEFGPVVEKMTADLKLDDAQAADIKRLVEEHQKQLRDIQNEMRQPPELVQKLGELRKKLQDAQAANDQAGMKQVTDEMQSLRREHMEKTRPARDKIMQSREELRGKLAAALREDQRPGFEKIWDEYMSGGAGRRGPPKNPRMLRSVVERLNDLTPDQKRQIDELFKQHDEATKGKKGPEAETHTQRLYDAVLALLTPVQREKVEPRLAPRGFRRPGEPRRPGAPEGEPGEPGKSEPQKPEP
jgi:hypothetical protein